MRKKASGFYADSLEMLLDTMCNFLGGIIFITLTLAVLTRDSSTPESNQRETAQLTCELESVTSSNEVVEAKIQYAMLQLQAPPLTTNLMRLPSEGRKTKKAWTLIIRYGRMYPLYTTDAEGRPTLVKNNQTLDWRGNYLEPKRGQGSDPEVMTTIVQALKDSGQTNYYFAFLVFGDSFDAFNRAKKTVLDLGMQCGWEPYAENKRLVLDGRGQDILPQN
jgi:hypothetical protein